MAEKYDVVIVGGGIVGLTLACALGDTALKVAVIEANPIESSWPEQSIGLRVSAITHATRKVFDHIDAWRGMVERRVTSYGEMHVWDASGSGEIHFDGAEAGAPSLGYIIENRIIVLALMERLQQFANINILCPTGWQRWSEEGATLALTLTDGRQLHTRLLVGADGVLSQVRERAGIETKGWGYDQHAVMAIVKTEKSHQHTCWQRFLPNGPLAFLPMHDHYSCVVWSTTPEQARVLMDDSESVFADKLAEAFDQTLGKVVEVCERGAFPLRLQHTVDYVKERIALIGDAAHAIHPLAGQGVNLGILDAAALAETVLNAYEARRDIGTLATLRRYERWRKGQNVAMMLSMDGFKRLFGSDVSALKAARNLGLNTTNSFTPLKRIFMEYAMGERGDLPKSAL